MTIEVVVVVDVDVAVGRLVVVENYWRKDLKQQMIVWASVVHPILPWPWHRRIRMDILLVSMRLD